MKVAFWFSALHHLSLNFLSFLPSLFSNIWIGFCQFLISLCLSKLGSSRHLRQACDNWRNIPEISYNLYYINCMKPSRRFDFIFACIQLVLSSKSEENTFVFCLFQYIMRVKFQRVSCILCLGQKPNNPTKFIMPQNKIPKPNALDSYIQ